MSVLYLHFDSPERTARVRQLEIGGTEIVVAEPRWPLFYEVAKRIQPDAVAIDFSCAPSHASETAAFISKAPETRGAALFLLRVPPDRVRHISSTLPNASFVTERELADRLTRMSQEANQRRRGGKAKASSRAGKGNRKAGEPTGREDTTELRAAFATLKIPTTATDAEVTDAYRRLARHNHPDKVAEMDPAIQGFAESRMKEINDALSKIRRARR